MDIKKLEARRKKVESSEEFENFKTMIDDVRDFFLPEGGRLRTQVAKGSKLNKRRVSDIGISFLNDYAAGIISELVTSGQRWFDVIDSKEVREDAEFFEYASRKMYHVLSDSNFHLELYRDQKSAGCDGTACFCVERIDGQIVFKHIPFGSFQFVQDFQERPDTVWMCKKVTAGALVKQFPDMVSDKVKGIAEKDPDCDVEIVYYCAKREKRDTAKRDRKNKP